MVNVPPIVWREVERHRPKALKSRRIRFKRVWDIPKPTLTLMMLVESYFLQPGETEALRLMRRLPQAILLTDDEAARLVAEQMEYRAYGTLGVLLRSLEQGLATKRQVLRVIRAIPTRSSLHVRRTFLNDVISEIEEGIV